MTPVNAAGYSATPGRDPGTRLHAALVMVSASSFTWSCNASSVLVLDILNTSSAIQLPLKRALLAPAAAGGCLWRQRWGRAVLPVCGHHHQCMEHHNAGPPARRFWWLRNILHKSSWELTLMLTCSVACVCI